MVSCLFPFTFIVRNASEILLNISFHVSQKKISLRMTSECKQNDKMFIFLCVLSL